MKKCISILGFSALVLHAASQEQAADPGHMTCGYNNLFNAYCAKHGIDPVNDPALLRYEDEISDSKQQFVAITYIVWLLLGALPFWPPRAAL